MTPVVLAQLVAWGFVVVAALSVGRLAVTSRRVADRSRLLRRVLGGLTLLLVARALGPWDALTWPLWGALAAAWAHGALVGAVRWRGMPWLAAGRAGPRRVALDVAAEAGLLLAVGFLLL